MGINYVDSIIIYNEYQSRRPEAQYYFGTRFDNVRIELTQGADITRTGTENASACVAKIFKTDFPMPYKPPEMWSKQTTEEMLESLTFREGKDFYVIVGSKGLGIDIDIPTGIINSDDYGDGGYFDYIKNKYGHAYALYKADFYGLIGYWALYGR